MAVPTILDTSLPTEDALRGTIADSVFAADLAAVLAGRASGEYRDKVRFFADTCPTRGLRNLLGTVCGCRSGSGEPIAAIVPAATFALVAGSWLTSSSGRHRAR